MTRLKPLLLRWPWVVSTLVGVVLGVSAFQAGDGNMVINTTAVAAMVLTVVGILAYAAGKQFLSKVSTAVSGFEQIAAALYGPRDLEGKHQGGGLIDISRQTAEAVSVLPELKREVEEALKVAGEAKELAKLAIDRRIRAEPRGDEP